MASPTETNSDSDATPIARETLNFDDDTLRGEKKREEVFKERGKPEHPEKNLSVQGREPTTKSTHI